MVKTEPKPMDDSVRELAVFVDAFARAVSEMSDSATANPSVRGTSASAPPTPTPAPAPVNLNSLKRVHSLGSEDRSEMSESRVVKRNVVTGKVEGIEEKERGKGKIRFVGTSTSESVLRRIEEGRAARLIEEKVEKVIPDSEAEEEDDEGEVVDEVVWGPTSSPVPEEVHQASNSAISSIEITEEDTAKLPDIARTVQRTGGNIPECLFQAEEQYQRDLSEGIFSTVPLREETVFDSDDEEILRLKKDVLGRALNKKRVGGELVRATTKEVEDLVMEVVKEGVSEMTELKGKSMRDWGDKKVDVDYEDMEDEEETMIPWPEESAFDHLPEIPRIHFYAANEEETLAAAEECERNVQNSRRVEKAKSDKIWQRVHEWAEKNGVKNSCPYPYTWPHEWPEKPHIREYLRLRLKGIPVSVVPKDIFRMSDALDKKPPLIHPPVPKNLIKTSIHIKDCDGESLFVKINCGAEEIFGFQDEDEKQHPYIDEHILAAMNKLSKNGCLPVHIENNTRTPTGSDTRGQFAPEHEAAQRDKWWKDQGIVTGVYHFACWALKGRKADAWGPSGPWNQQLSSDIWGKGPPKFGFRLRFLMDIAPVQQIMSLWFEAIDPVQYKEYRDHVDLMCKDNTGMEGIRFAQNHSFLGVAVNRNLEVANHRDSGDVPDGYVGMMCCGRFTGGELCLPDFGFRSQFLPGDVILFRSALLQHFVQAAVGQRSSLVFFSHSSLRNRWQNAKYMKDDEYEAAMEKKIEVMKVKEQREIKMKEYKDLDPYPTVAADLKSAQMKHAKARKTRFVKYAKQKFKEGTMTKEDLKEVEKTAVPLFYELNLVELARHAKGCYPFAPMGCSKRRKAN